MKCIERKRSVITGKQNLEHLYTLKDFPVFFGCVTHRPEEDVRADMSWAICPESGVIQLDRLIPLDVLYQEQHVDGTGPTWERYYQDFARYIVSQPLKNDLEIGGGAGKLANLVVKQSSDVTWTIVEPNPLVKETSQIKVVSGFFDENFKFSGDIDTVVFSQVMEHVYDPHAFVKSIAKFLKVGGKLICAYPNLASWLKNKHTNAINFEHNMFLTDYFVDLLFKKYGFEIRDKHFYEDHSIYYTAEKVGGEVDDFLFKNKYEEYKKIFTDYMEYYETLVLNLNKQIAAFDGEVYVFGAHIFAQHLLEVGLNAKKIKFVIDNSPLKEGKRLYGTNLFVRKPDVIKGRKSAVVLKVGVHRDDILKQLLSINPEVTIFE